MTYVSPQELDEIVTSREFSFEEVLEVLNPIIERYARKARIWGMEACDIQQELVIVAWKAYEGFNPEKTGYRGRRSTFYNYLVSAFENMLGKLLYKSKKFYQSISHYVCEGCQAIVGEKGRCACGNGRRKAVGGHITASLDWVMASPGPGWRWNRQNRRSCSAHAAAAARDCLAGSR